MPDEGSYKHILFAVEDGVATITLNRPKRLNAFHVALGAELESAYARCDADDAVRAVVLTGAGKAFCVGADMGGGGKTFDDVEGGRRAADPGPGARRLAAWQVRKPVIAAMTGFRTRYAARPRPPRPGSAARREPLTSSKVLSPPPMSAPAQKAFPAPVRTTARTASSASQRA